MTLTKVARYHNLLCQKTFNREERRGVPAAEASGYGYQSGVQQGCPQFLKSESAFIPNPCAYVAICRTDTQRPATFRR